MKLTWRSKEGRLRVFGEHCHNIQMLPDATILNVSNYTPGSQRSVLQLFFWEGQFLVDDHLVTTPIKTLNCDPNCSCSFEFDHALRRVFLLDCLSCLKVSDTVRSKSPF